METVDRFEPAVVPKLNRLPVMKERVRSSKFAKKFVGSAGSAGVSWGDTAGVGADDRGSVLWPGEGITGVAVPIGYWKRFW